MILAGHGTLRVAGEMLPLRAGDIAFIPPGPDYPHQIINTSDAPLRYLSISTRETPEIVSIRIRASFSRRPRRRKAGASMRCTGRAAISTTGMANHDAQALSLAMRPHAARPSRR